MESLKHLKKKKTDEIKKWRNRYEPVHDFNGAALAVFLMSALAFSQVLEGSC